MANIGKISQKEALDWGFSGPSLRATGVLWDLRKNQPYDVYDEMEFKIPTGTNGDCYERFLVRVEEMKQSLDIIRQCIDRMPKGICMSPDQKKKPPKR